MPTVQYVTFDSTKRKFAVDFWHGRLLRELLPFSVIFAKVIVVAGSVGNVASQHPNLAVTNVLVEPRNVELVSVQARSCVITIHGGGVESVGKQS